MQRMKGPVALILTRQKLPVLDQSRYPSAHNLEKGAYMLSEAQGSPELILIATGSEVQLALGAQEVLQAEGTRVRVVSMPSWELFERQDRSYRNAVLPPAVRKRVAVEAGVTFGWYKYVTHEGTVVGIDRFGESGPGEEVMQAFGFTVEKVCNQARAVLQRTTSTSDLSI
jgi:transketolase